MTTTIVSTDGFVPPPTGSIFSTFEVRDLETTDSLTRLAGRAVPYNTSADIGNFTEEFTRAAFDKSTREGARALPLLLFHNQRGWPIGAAEEWRSKPDGLHGVWRLDQGEEAQQAARMARDGFLSYLSITFQQVPGRFRIDNRRDKPHIIREEARLVETSLTSTPAYANSTVSWVRDQSPTEPRPATDQRYRWDMYLRELKQGQV